MGWLSVYVPWDGLDAGLKVLLVVWVVTTVAGVMLAFCTDRRGPPP